MIKLLIILLTPLFIYAKSATLVKIVDGDSAILKDGKTRLMCQLGDLDTPELKLNNKLKREMKYCKFSKEKFISAGKLSFKEAKKILKVGQKYEYTIPRYFPNKNPVCYLKIPKGLHTELYPYFDKLMVSYGFALPYVIYSTPKQSKYLLRAAKEAKRYKKGLWKTHPKLMQCLVEHRYSLRSLRN